jgi:hypothetical protein
MPAKAREIGASEKVLAKGLPSLLYRFCGLKIISISS